MKEKESCRSEMSAVKKSGSYLRNVEKQTPELCLAAVRQNGRALRYVKEQTPDICRIAVYRDFRALQFVKEQSPEICLTALLDAKWRGEAAVSLALSLIAPQIWEDPDFCLPAARLYAPALQFVKEQTAEICLAAIKKSKGAIRFVKNAFWEDAAFCGDALAVTPAALQSVKEQTPELCLNAVKQKPAALKYVKAQTPEVCLAAVQNDPAILERVLLEYPDTAEHFEENFKTLIHKPGFTPPDAYALLASPLDAEKENALNRFLAGELCKLWAQREFLPPAPLKTESTDETAFLPPAHLKESADETEDSFCRFIRETEVDREEKTFFPPALVEYGFLPLEKPAGRFQKACRSIRNFFSGGRLFKGEKQC